MRILGIETSCDETAIAVIEISGSRARPRIKVLSNIVSSQAKLHAKFGGVVPNLAKREHQRNLVPVLLTALSEANPSNKTKSGNRYDRSYFRMRGKLRDVGEILEREPELFARLAGALAKRARMVEYVLPLEPPKIDAIAVTVGPGLAPALWVGVNFARALSLLWDKPIIPVNHLEGHVYTNLLPQIGKLKTQSSKLKTFEFPALCLIVSGGHTELVLMRSYGKYKIIGETLDDAAGEAFDKVAKMMNLGFPGGPEIAAEAAKIQNSTLVLSSGRGKIKSQNDPEQITSQFNGAGKSKFKIKLPRPMINSADYNFSFSGLKTAVLYLLRDSKGRCPLSKIRSAVASEFQQAVVDVLVAKTIKAAKKFEVKTVMIGGGVAANEKLRRDLGVALSKTMPAARYMLPVVSLTGDNALMIALAGWFRRRVKTRWRSLKADANLRLDV